MAPKTPSPAPASKRPTKRAKEIPAEDKASVIAEAAAGVASAGVAGVAAAVGATAVGATVSEATLADGADTMADAAAGGAAAGGAAAGGAAAGGSIVESSPDTETGVRVQVDSPVSDPDKLAEIIKLVQKLQRSANKTQRSVNVILQHLEGVDPKNKRTRPKKEPSGFAKPSLLSDEMCDFLEMPRGSKLARTEVTKKLTFYIKDNNLQNPANKKQILLDDKLRRLLNVDDKTVLTFFTIQKYLSNHKKEAVDPMDVSTEASAEAA